MTHLEYCLECCLFIDPSFFLQSPTIMGALLGNHELPTIITTFSTRDDGTLVFKGEMNASCVNFFGYTNEDMHNDSALRRASIHLKTIPWMWR